MARDRGILLVGATLVDALGASVGAILLVALGARASAAPVGVTLVVARSAYALPKGKTDIDDITGKYHFLSPDDTLGILEEEGKLKGYVEITQGEEESDDMLSYQIVAGSRQNDHVEFKTNIIHRKYYRFSGKVERGPGRQTDDPDYLRLVGDLETVTVKGDSGQESVERKHLVLKGIGKSERNEE
jgi:hypothetical protein